VNGPRSLYSQPEPPRVVARRVVELPLRRTLELLALEDSGGHADIWLRVRTADGLLVGQLHSRPSALRAIAGALHELAGELGIAP
jgi:hypothetical protein